MLEISIEKNCPVKNIPLKDLTKKFPDFKANILGALRKEKFVYLKKNDKILEGDNIYVVVSSDQLNAILNVFDSLNIQSPTILSIVKGSKRIRASETILSRDGIIEMPKDSSGFRLLQQVRDESHRFALRSSRKKKLKELQYSELNLINGVGPIIKNRLLKKFKNIKNIRNASVHDLLSVQGVSKKLCEQIQQGLK